MNEFNELVHPRGGVPIGRRNAANLGRFTIDRLVTILSGLGHEVEVSVDQAQVQDTCKKWSQGCWLGDAGPLGDLTDHAAACATGDFGLDLPNAEIG
jgi:hypothetical protein